MANNIPITVGELIEATTINTWARGYLRKTTAKTVNTTTTATDLLNGEFTLPAGAMGTTKVVRVTATGDWLSNAGSAKDVPRFQFGLGGTTLLDTGVTGIAIAGNTAQRSSWRFEWEIQNLGAANSQQAYLTGALTYSAQGTTVSSHYFSGSDGAVFIDNYGAGQPARVSYDGGHTAAVDTTASCAVTLKVINASNSATYETQLLGALLEVI